MAYNQTQKLIYASAFLKRHVGLRENSGAANPLGAIYQVNPGNTANGSLFFDLSTIDNTIGTVATNAARGLGVPTAPSADPTVYDQIAKIGIGDIDISEDNQYLYTMSLGSKNYGNSRLLLLSAGTFPIRTVGAVVLIEPLL